MDRVEFRYLDIDCISGKKVVKVDYCDHWFEDGSYTFFSYENEDSFIIPTVNVCWIKYTKE